MTLFIDPSQGQKLPTQLEAGETYAFKGGTTYAHSVAIQINAPGVTLTSYGEGRCTLLPDNVAPDGKTIRVGEPGFTCDNLYVVAPGSGDAIMSANVDGLTVKGSYLDGRAHCIAQHGGDNFSITENIMVGAGRGYRRFAGDPGPTTCGLIANNGITCDPLTSIATSHGIGFGADPENDWDYGLIIEGNTINNAKTASMDGAHMTRVIFKDNRCIGAGTPTAEVTQMGMILGSSATRGAQLHKVYGNTFEGMKMGIYTRSGGGCFVFDNVFRDNAHHVWNSLKYSDNNLYTNNLFDGATKSAVRVTDNNCGIGLFGNTYINNAADFEIDPGCQAYGGDL